MAKRIVKTDGLNLRKKPLGKIITSLKLGKKVEVLGDADVEGWKRVEVKKNGDRLEGVVFAKYLRKPVSKKKEALIKACVDEWIRFKRGERKENQDPQYKYVGEMWKYVDQNLNGKNSNPWSAAFISFVVGKKAEYADFKKSTFHTKYIHDSIQKKVLGQNAPFWGYRRKAKKPKLGDIVCAWRVNAHEYDDLENSGAFRPSHCDVIVEVNKNSVRTLGGNVAHSVTMKTFPLNSNGHLKSGRKVTALMKNKL